MSYSGETVLVTGADGFIGPHATEALVRENADATALAFYNFFDSHGGLDDLLEAIRKKLTLARDDIRDSAYNVGSQRSVTISDVLDLVLELVKSNKPVRRDESRLRPHNSEVRALQANSSRFERETGWQAHTTLREGLKQTISWWRNRLGEGRVRHERNYMT